MAQNQFKFFRGVNDRIVNLASDPTLSSTNGLLTKRYDEPTYMTFRVLFGQNSGTWSGTTLLNTNYDRMPHPLFINQQVDATQRQGQGGRNVVDFNRDTYSTIDFLRDSNEFTRAEMLKEFIIVWEDLQKSFPWYFQSIDGISDLLRPTPERGKRVGQDVRLTFNMAEGIDQRISYLLNLYQKIAWDDTYQRWVLPDLMRFFDIQIYITEFRTFHQSQVTPNSNDPVYLQVLNGILPTYLIQCEMCEFDINTFEYSYRNSINVSENPENATVSFQVKVGNVNEVSTYPLFSHFILDDYRINGTERSKEKGFVKSQDGRITNAIDQTTGLPIEKDYTATKSGDLRYRNLDQIAQETFFQEDHYSGRPYIQSSLSNNIKNSSPNYSLDTESVNPIEPATWVGNALTFGKSFGVNFVTQKLDQAKMTKIPGLGFSFNEAVSAIQSKDFTSVLGLVRRAINDSVTGGPPSPSQLLDEQIDNTFKQFLTGLADSEATDGDELELKDLAIKVLSDRGKWEEIKDLSYATNLKGPNEVNKEVKIENENIYKDVVTGIEGIDDQSLEGIGSFYGDVNSQSATESSVTGDEGPYTDLISDATNQADLGNKGPYTSVISDATLTNPNEIGGKGPTTNLSDNTTIIQQGQIIQAAPSSATSGRKLEGNKLSTTNILSGGTDKEISGKLKSTTILSEATNGLDAEQLKQPKPSKATNNKIE